LLTASAQLRSAGRQGAALPDELIAFGSDHHWQQAVLDYAVGYAAQVKKDYQEYFKAYKAGYFSPPRRCRFGPIRSAPIRSAPSAPHHPLRTHPLRTHPLRTHPLRKHPLRPTPINDAPVCSLLSTHFANFVNKYSTWKCSRLSGIDPRDRHRRAMGAEREYRSKSAGFRTLTLICLGAALFTILSELIGAKGAPERIASNVVVGIGFVAPASSSKAIRDIARSMHYHSSDDWVTAALGMAIGAGFEMIAFIACC